MVVNRCMSIFQNHIQLSQARQEAKLFLDMMTFNHLGSSDTTIVEEAFSKTAQQDARASFEFAKELSVNVPKNRIKDIEKAVGNETGMWVILELDADTNAIKRFFKDQLIEVNSIIQRMKAELDGVKGKKLTEDDEEDMTIGSIVGSVLPSFDNKPQMESYKGRLYLFLVMQYHLSYIGSKDSPKPLKWADKVITDSMLKDILHIVPNDVIGELFVEVSDRIELDPKKWKARVERGFAEGFLNTLLELSKPTLRKK